jgi:Fe-S-cluster containining protein
VFLGSEGCTVHSDRPLVCRVYPLGRHLRDDGAEWFSHVKRHPQSAGERVDKGTIADYLEEQGAGPFLKAADEYFYWLCATLEQLDAELLKKRSKSPAEDTHLAAELIDMDIAIAHHCAITGRVEPTDIEERKHLHLAILYQKIRQYDGGKDDKASQIRTFASP